MVVRLLFILLLVGFDIRLIGAERRSKHLMRNLNKLFLLVTLMLAYPRAGAEEPLVLALWPGAVPGDFGKSARSAFARPKKLQPKPPNG